MRFIVEHPARPINFLKMADAVRKAGKLSPHSWHSDVSGPQNTESYYCESRDLRMATAILRLAKAPKWQVQGGTSVLSPYVCPSWLDQSPPAVDWTKAGSATPGSGLRNQRSSHVSWLRNRVFPFRREQSRNNHAVSRKANHIKSLKCWCNVVV